MIIFLIIKLIKKIFLSLLFIIFFICLNQSYIKASEKIATVVKVQNTVYAVNIEGEERLLKLYDSIYLNDLLMQHQVLNHDDSEDEDLWNSFPVPI